MYDHMTPYDRGAANAALAATTGSEWGQTRALERNGGAFTHHLSGPAPARVSLVGQDAPPGYQRDEKTAAALVPREPLMTSDLGQPGRPYGSPDDLAAHASRSQQMQLGAAGDPDNIATATARPDAGLTADRLRQWRAMTPKGYTPGALILTPIGRNPGGNGMSAADASRRWADGSYMGSPIGTSESSFEPAALLRMTGLDEW